MPLSRTPRIVCTIEARMTSSRLPGKVLLPLGCKPALQSLVDRVRRARRLDDVVVATTTNRTDDPIAHLCQSMECPVYRGSEHDVLSRVLGAAESRQADVIVEITGDCPCIDPGIIDQVVETFLAETVDYATNGVRRSFPDGLGVQVFPVAVLRQTAALTDDPIDRVHVSRYIYTHPERFRLRFIEAQGELCWPELRITLDELRDYVFLDALFHGLFPENPHFSALDVVRYLRARPELLEINRTVRTKSTEEGQCCAPW